MASIIIGARTDEQLSDNLKATELVLSEEERRRLDEVSAPPLIYPYWHQAKTASDRLARPTCYCWVRTWTTGPSRKFSRGLG